MEFSLRPDAYPDIFHPRLELIFPEGWRPDRVRYSPSRGTNLDIFRPILESLVFLETGGDRVGFSRSHGASLGIFVHT